MAKYLKNLNGNTYSVLEANFLAARRTGQVKAQLPLAEAIDVAENGQFFVYNEKDGEVQLPTNEDTKNLHLHFSVEKEYDNIRPGLHNYAIVRHGAAGKQGTPYPRLFRVARGDVFTTDAVKLDATTAEKSHYDALVLGAKMGIGNDGFIDAVADGAGAEGVILELIAKTTLPDGGLACKFKVVQDE